MRSLPNIPARRATHLLDTLQRRIEDNRKPTFDPWQRRFLLRQLAELAVSLADPNDLRHALLDRREVAVIWCIEDVQSVRPHVTDEQAWDVLLECESSHDCEFGFTWSLIETVADELFPAPKKGKSHKTGTSLKKGDRS